VKKARKPFRFEIIENDFHSIRVVIASIYQAGLLYYACISVREQLKYSTSDSKYSFEAMENCQIISQVFQVIIFLFEYVALISRTIMIRLINFARFLDISDCYEVEYTNPDEALTDLVESLPYLESLDITHTNLAGTGRARSERPRVGGVTDIVGLRSRASKPLKFLGLYGTLHDACRRHHVPAEMVQNLNLIPVFLAIDYRLWTRWCEAQSSF
jgi:hypothetical protein